MNGRAHFDGLLLSLLVAIPSRAVAASLVQAAVKKAAPAVSVRGDSRLTVLSAAAPLALLPLTGPSGVAARPALDPAASAMPVSRASAPAAHATPRIPAAPVAGAPAPLEGKPAHPALESLESLLTRLKVALDSALEPEVLRSGDLAFLGEPGQVLKVNSLDASSSLPTLVRVEDADAQNPMIRIPLERADGSLIQVSIRRPRKDLRGAPRRPVDSALCDLRLAISHQTTFEPGETVRVRDETTGLLQRMVLVGLFVSGNKTKKFEVRDAAGRSRLTPMRLVYKDVGVGEPFTSRIPEQPRMLWAPFEPRRGGTLENFLDGAAWLGSHPEFLAASHEQRWETLARYVGAVMRPGMEARFAERLGLGFPELLKLGVGVCRHLATLTAAVLREAGYDARIVILTKGREGHAWVEVHAPAGSVGESWIIDLMKSVIISASQADFWYRHPGRVEYPPRPVSA